MATGDRARRTEEEAGNVRCQHGRVRDAFTQAKQISKRSEQPTAARDFELVTWLAIREEADRTTVREP